MSSISFMLPASTLVVAAAAVLYRFERAPDQPPQFPELLLPGRQAVLLAVDPDLQGALVALSWRNPPSAPATDEAAAGSAAIDLAGVDIQVHDMPLETWKYGSRDKRQPDAGALIRVLAQCGADGGVGVGGGESSSVLNSSSSGSNDSSGSVGAGGSDTQPEVTAAAPAVVRALVEYSMPPHVCGKFAWFGIGFSVGLLNGLLVARGIDYARVPGGWVWAGGRDDGGGREDRRAPRFHRCLCCGRRRPGEASLSAARCPACLPAALSPVHMPRSQHLEDADGPEEAGQGRKHRPGPAPAAHGAALAQVRGLAGRADGGGGGVRADLQTNCAQACVGPALLLTIRGFPSPPPPPPPHPLAPATAGARRTTGEQRRCCWRPGAWACAWSHWRRATTTTTTVPKGWRGGRRRTRTRTTR